MTYLQPSDTKTEITEESLKKELDIRIEKATVELAKTQAELDQKLKATDWKAATVTAEEKTEFINSITANIKETAADDFLDEIREKVIKQEKENIEFDKHKQISDSITRVFNRSIDRFKGAINDQYKRGTLNLLIGIFITAVGLIVLWYYVSQLRVDPDNPWIVAETFFPRLGLVILIEIFAFFFLKLYRASLVDVKYFQNELTNFEAKYIALWVAYQEKDREMFEEVIKIMAKTERNLVLEKGQSTIELEREKRESETIFKVLDSVSGIAKKTRKG
jgi:hypothetical protein